MIPPSTKAAPVGSMTAATRAAVCGLIALQSTKIGFTWSDFRAAPRRAPKPTAAGIRRAAEKPSVRMRWFGDNQSAGIDAMMRVLAQSLNGVSRTMGRQQVRILERRTAMKNLSVVALLAGMALAIPAFAQTPDPATNAVVSGTGGAATGALIGCIVTIPIGCAPGAALCAAVGGGVGATTGVVTTPAYPPP